MAFGNFGKKKKIEEETEEKVDILTSEEEIDTSGSLQASISDSEDAVQEEEIQESMLEKIRKKVPIIGTIVDLILTYKKQLIKSAACILGFALIFTAGNEVRKIFKAEDDAVTQKYINLQNDVTIFKQNNPYFTNIQGSMGDNKDAVVEWIGDKIDHERVSLEKKFFWKWIEPAVNYSNAEEYTQNRLDFIEKKNIGDSLFIKSFLTKYDANAYMSTGDIDKDGKLSSEEILNLSRQYDCYTDYDKYYAYPIGMTEDGDYHYMAIVPYAGYRSAFIENKHKVIAFTYTVKHIIDEKTNTETLTVEDFNYWPYSSIDY